MTRSFSCNRGFSLVELLVVTVLLMFVILISASGFESVMKINTGLTRSAQSQTEGMVGLEMLRKDLNSAGYGLPWSFQVTPTGNYLEADLAADVPVKGVSAALFNDAPPNSGSAVPTPAAPRAVLVGSVSSSQATILASGGTVNSNPGTDYLVIKSAAVSFSPAAGKWAYVNYSGNQLANVSYIPKWNNAEDLGIDDAVITHVSTFSVGGQAQHVLAQMDAQHFSYRMKNSSSPATGCSTVNSQGRFIPEHDNYKPSGSLVDPFGTKINNEKVIVYGVNAFSGGTDSIRMPYNRADYFVMRPATGMPAACNPGTGKLYKAVLNNWLGDAGGQQTLYPLLDCVGDLQVVFELVDQANPTNTGFRDDLGSLSAADIRQQLKYIRVYILAHEGGKDLRYSYPYSNPAEVVVLGDRDIKSMGRTFSETDMLNFFGPDWKHYRWKVYTIVGEPRNLVY
jgi:hypothetical protein